MAPLRVVRTRQLLTPRELAQKAKVAPATIYAIEGGDHRPQLRVIRKICQALGVEPTEVDEFRRLIEGESDRQGLAA